MDYVFSEHALDQMADRGVTREEVDTVIQNPQQITDERRGRKGYQSLIIRNNRIMLLRVVIAPNANPPVVVSVYATTQGRYWRT